MRVPYLTGDDRRCRPKGSVLPDSYGYQRGESRAAVLGADAGGDAARAGAALGASGGPDTRRAEPAGGDHPRLDRREGDRQAVRAADWSPASIRNRLRLGMKLAGRSDRHLSDHPGQAARPADPAARSCSANNGYNTYALAGLPIGPIANPGRASIAAVLNPAPTNALYFVADGTGGHVFADTLAAAQRQRAALVRDPPRPRRDVSPSSASPSGRRHRRARRAGRRPRRSPAIVTPISAPRHARGQSRRARTSSRSMASTPSSETSSSSFDQRLSISRPRQPSAPPKTAIANAPVTQAGIAAPPPRHRRAAATTPTVIRYW